MHRCDFSLSFGLTSKVQVSVAAVCKLCQIFVSRGCPFALSLGLFWLLLLMEVQEPLEEQRAQSCCGVAVCKEVQ